MLRYNDPPTTKSEIDGAGSGQMNTFLWHRKALVEAQKEAYFSPLASTWAMPKHYGKEIRAYHYLPLLDARNVNDQGIDAAGATIVDGNLYGSSRDVGTITSRLPVLTEDGGRVNRVGFTRLEISGALHKFGFFTEFTQESLDFDSDAELYSHISTEMVKGATEITEAILQKDLLNAAGTVVFGGVALDDDEIIGEGANISEVTYDDLSRLNRVLNDNRTPKQTQVIKGSMMVDTMTVSGGRIMFIGSDLQPTIENMVDPFGNAAFIPVRKYAAAGKILNGEIGAVGEFRFVVVPEMQHWEGAGAAVTTNAGYMETGGNYDVYPMLCVGGDSFVTIGFQSGGKTHKFKILTKMPGRETAHAASDPYGETGFSSIKWYYGFMPLRPERIALVKTVARI